MIPSSLTASLRRWPSGLQHHPDVVLAAAVALILGLLVLPVPPAVLDVLLAANIAAAALVLVAVLLSERPLALSTFPSLLLVTTLARLALNVSSTRLILGRGQAGELVEAFGQFVVRGDMIMGLVVFAILVLVQLLVIGKGAERVAEVGARFTLDALPGRQMSIDAALRAGTITDDQADEQRRELQRESQFHGAMDGAMKFVKGDAIAGLVIIALNLVAGLGIGVFRHGLEVPEAARVYSILTVGDGLVAQIPALLVTLSAGVLTTRVASETPRMDLGRSLGRELFGRPKALAIAAAFCVMLGVVPGLPAVPFLSVAALFAFGAVRTSGGFGARVAAKARENLERRIRAAEVPKPVSDPAPAVSPIAVDLDPELSAALGIAGGDEAQSELVKVLLPQLRNAIFLETGVRIPGVRVRAQVETLPRQTVLIRVKEVPVAVEAVNTNAALVLQPPSQLTERGFTARPAVHPVHGRPGASEVDPATADALTAQGVNVWRPAGVVALHVARVAREHLPTFVGLHETHDLLERARQVYPTLVAEVVPALISLARLAEVLRRLVEERVSIRDAKSILEAIAERGDREDPAWRLTEHVREALALQLAHDHAGPGGKLAVVVLEPTLEAQIRASLVEGPSGPEPALAPELRAAVLEAAGRALRPLIEAGRSPVLLTHPDVRPWVRAIVGAAVPEVVALSARELPPRLPVEPVGQLSAGSASSAARPSTSHLDLPSQFRGTERMIRG